MDEEKFNLTVRKFLKEVGVTSQREIEKAVRDALSTGSLRDGATIDAKMTLTVDAIGVSHQIVGHIELG
jgi:ribosomal protein L1